MLGRSTMRTEVINIGTQRYLSAGRAGLHNGYDIRLPIGPNDNPEAFDINGGFFPNNEVCEAMLERLEKGEKKAFDNLPYPVKVIGADFFYCGSPDMIGNRTWKAKVFIEGHHDGFGIKNGNPWTGPETIAYASVWITPWEPGKISCKLIPSGKYSDVNVEYDRYKGNGKMRQKVEEAKKIVEDLRKKRKAEESSDNFVSLEMLVLETAAD